MKIKISLENIPISIEIEGSDEITKDMIDFVTKTLFKLREVWLNAIKCQVKLESQK